MYQYHCLNPISNIGLSRFTEEYQKTDSMEDAEGVLVRSAAMHDLELPKKRLGGVAGSGQGAVVCPAAGRENGCGGIDKSLLFGYNT